MTINLVVVRAFAEYAKGATITDAGTITTILAGDYKYHVVRVAVKGS
jgi:hypothetical protein